MNDPFDLCVTSGESTERTGLRAVCVDDVELSSTQDGLEVGECRSIVCQGDLTTEMFLKYHLKPGLPCFLNEPVSTSDDEHNFVTIGVQSHCSAQSDSSGTGHEPCHDLGDPQTLGHVPAPSSAKVGANRLPSGGTGRSPSVTS